MTAVFQLFHVSVLRRGSVGRGHTFRREPSTLPSSKPSGRGLSRIEGTCKAGELLRADELPSLS